MKRLRDFVVASLVGGLLILAPIYIAILLLLKAMGSPVGLIRPIASLLPDWVPAEQLLVAGIRVSNATEPAPVLPRA